MGIEPIFANYFSLGMSDLRKSEFIFPLKNKGRKEGQKMKVRNLEKCFTNQGKFLRKVRLANGLSQGQLADLLGLNTFQSISNTERYLQAMPFYMWVIIHNNYPFDWNELKEALCKDHESWINAHYLLTNDGMNQEQISQQ